MESSYSLLQIIESLTRSIGEIESQILETGKLSNLSMRQVYYLDVICQMKAPTSSQLAQHLHLSKPSITAIIGHLMQQGYVFKSPSDADGRSFHICLTAKGEEVARLHEHAHQQFAESFSSALDEAELAQLVALMNKVIQFNRRTEPANAHKR
jgi:DNA-binding MarR family transcriptional regulator